MNIVLLCVGSLKERFWEDATKDIKRGYKSSANLKLKNCQSKTSFQVLIRLSPKRARRLLQISKAIPSFSILKVKNSQVNSLPKISSLFQKSSTLTFIIGGSYGVSEEVKKRVDERLSFGKITLPHNLARVVALEQIYRAFMINGGGKYHK